jgi:hypothetical protein
MTSLRWPVMGETCKQGCVHVCVYVCVHVHGRQHLCIFMCQVFTSLFHKNYIKLF